MEIENKLTIIREERGRIGERPSGNMYKGHMYKTKEAVLRVGGGDDWGRGV